MLCRLCSSLDWLAIVTALSVEEFLEIEHHSDWKSLCLAADHDCSLCALFVQAIADAYEEAHDWTIQETNSYHESKDQDHNTIFVLSTHHSGHGVNYDRRFDAETREAFSDTDRSLDAKFPDGITLRPFLRVCLENGSLTNIHNRTVSETADFALCKEWIDECSSMHPDCTSIQDSDLPTRLIDVGTMDGLQEPKLVETQGLRGKYVTLSHCWGNSDPPVTDITSFSAYKERIPFSTLPKTFQDAITSVRQLGYRWLWIDCFCIIQGDQVDWEIECSRMHHTFANSALTIAGPNAWNTKVGFLYQRPKPVIGPCKLQIRDKQGYSLGNVTVELVDPGACSTGGFPRVQQASALTSRAWTVQERYLSPRTLYFGSSQAYLECKTTHLFEMSRKRQDIVMDIQVASRRHVQLDSDRTQSLESWYQVVEVYSCRRLTKECDKLPALSGIASRVAQVVPGAYLAGLWGDDLLRGLHWRIPYHCDKQSLSRDQAVQKPPSWSWASCDHPTVNQLKGAGLESAWDAEVIGASVSVPGRDPYGQVTDGKLVLRGKLRKARVHPRLTDLSDDFWLRHAEKATTSWYVTDIDGTNSEVAGWASDNTSEDHGFDASRDIYCILLGQHVRTPEYAQDAVFLSLSQSFWTALALEPTHIGASVFRRTGLLKSTDFASNETLHEFQSSTALADQDAARAFFADSVTAEIEIV